MSHAKYYHYKYVYLKKTSLLTKKHVSVEVSSNLGPFFFKITLLNTVFLLNAILYFFSQLFPKMCL